MAFAASPLVYRTCPLCSDGDLRLHLVCRDAQSGQSYVLTRCGACSFVFTQGTDWAEVLSSYDGSYIPYAGKGLGVVSRIASLMRFFTIPARRRMIERVCGKKRGSLLEIGSGTGEFLAHMRKSGWQAEGTEISEHARGECLRRHGITARPAADLETLSAPYDVVLLWHTLEHVQDPSEIIRQVSRLLAPDGLCVIAAPNWRSFDAGYYGAEWYGYDVPRHLWHFDTKTMDMLLAHHGLRTAERQSSPLTAYYTAIRSAQRIRASVLRSLFIARTSNSRAHTDARLASSITYLVRRAD